ncbi:plasmid replication protein, CyRepA1 family [Richelia sinica]|uniref:plasmid replication protein, CyRepA1 family n=1 Tax=Richelia sinica TaxID=1357545 RepID=UPI001686963A|nr:plasmid replication protein, CyRepA1 family [Richelia sinica]MBD2667312.1 DUF3854 domain-containing protein [Richelia sinica FACHB-800]
MSNTITRDISGNVNNSEWCCLKADYPRQDEDGKIIKYEHPAKTNTQCFLARVSPQVWEKIAAKAGVPLPENYQDVLINPGLFWTWVIENSVTLVFVEGLKKALAMLTAGYAAIGFPGISNVIRQPKNEHKEKVGHPHPIPELDQFLRGSSKIILAFDSDTKRSSKRNVNNAIERTGKVLQFAGCSVKVATWATALGKGLDDVLVALGEEAIDGIYKNAIDFPVWQTNRLKQLTYVPDIVLNQKYLTNRDDKGKLTPAFKLPLIWQFLALKCHKGGSKSGYISTLISPLIRSGERKALLLTHRVSLGKALCESFGLNYIHDNDDDAELKGYHLGLCFDSLHRINPQDWKGAYLIIDELQQFIWHALSSKPCVSRRVELLKKLKELINVIVESDGKIIVADADLRDDGLDFICGLSNKEIKPYLVVNYYVRDEKDSWKIYNYNDKNADRIIDKLVEKLKAGERVLLCDSGQREKSKYGTTVVEKLINKLLPDVKTLRVDRVTLGTLNHPANGCLDSFYETIQNYQLVLTSPSVETGVSWDFEYFDCVFGIFNGTHTCDGIRQHLSRYRKPVDRYIYINKNGDARQKIGNGSTNVKQLLAGEYRKNDKNITALSALGFDKELDDGLDSIFINTWAVNGVILNDTFSKYRYLTLEDLKAEGHQVINVDADDDFEPINITKVRDEVYDDYCQKVEAAKDITEDDIKTLEQKKAISEQQRYEIDKAKLAKVYQIPVTADLVRKNDEGWQPQIKLHHLLLNKDSLERQELNIVESSHKRGKGQRAIWDDNKSFSIRKVWALLEIGFLELLNTTGLYENHPLAVKFGNGVRANLKDLKLFICDFSEKDKKEPSNMFVIRKALSLIGYKIPQIKQKRIDGELAWIHGCPAPDFETTTTTSKNGKERKKLVLDANGEAIPIWDGRDQVFAAWKAKEQEQIVREQEILAQFRIPSELLPIMSREVQNKNYSGTRKWFEKALSQAIKSSNYWEVVAVVEKLESVVVKPDNLGHLTADQSTHNAAIQEILKDVIGSNFEAIKILQTSQSKWHEGHRQLLTFNNSVATTEQEKHLVQPQSQSQARNPERKLTRDVNKEKLEFETEAKRIKNLILNFGNKENIGLAYQAIKDWGIKMKAEIEKFLDSFSNIKMPQGFNEAVETYYKLWEDCG